MITMDQLAQAVRAQGRAGEEARLGEIMVELGLIDRAQLAKLIAAQQQVIAKQKAKSGGPAPAAPPQPARAAAPVPRPVAAAKPAPAPAAAPPRPASAPATPAPATDAGPPAIGAVSEFAVPGDAD